MSVSQICLLILGCGLAVASAGLSAIETAVFSMNEERRRKLRSRNRQSAVLVEEVLGRPGEVMSALLLATTLANVPLIVVTLYLLESFGYGQDFLGWGMMAVVFGGVILVCELLPKLLALAMPVRLTVLGLPVVRGMLPVLEPVTDFLRLLCERVVEFLIPQRVVPSPYLTTEELETLIDIAQDEGTLNETEGRLIREVLKLGREPAKHCMTPRVDVFMIPDDIRNADAADVLRGRRYRRVPVRGANPDDILGILDVKEFLLRVEIPIAEQVQPPAFVPETMGALVLLRAFLKRRQHLAILLDEYGGIEGIVTLSDIIEELLGEEGPDSRSELYIEKLGENRALAAGNARLDDLAEALDWELEEAESVETIGGLVVEHLGFLPRVGATISINGRRIVVRRATRKRIKEVFIEPSPDAMNGTVFNPEGEE